MGILSVRLPDSLHKGVRELAEREGISINQFIATAVAEKLGLPTHVLDDFRLFFQSQLQVSARFG